MIYENYEELIKEHQIPINSDLFEFVKLYKRFVIELRIGAFELTKRRGEYAKLCGEYVYQIQMVSSDSLMVSMDDHKTENEKFDGYAGFYSEVHFDNNGKFIRQGFWE